MVKIIHRNMNQNITGLVRGSFNANVGANRAHWLGEDFGLDWGRVIAVLCDDENDETCGNVLDFITTHTPVETVRNFATDAHFIVCVDEADNDLTEGESDLIAAMRHEVDLYNDCFDAYDPEEALVALTGRDCDGTPAY